MDEDEVYMPAAVGQRRRSSRQRLSVAQARIASVSPFIENFNLLNLHIQSKHKPIMFLP